MTGDTVDSNSAMIAQSLAVQGFDVAHKVTVGDDIDLIVAELDKLAALYPAIIINGGLGPTIDDLTSEALSLLTGEPLVENTQALTHENEWCELPNPHKRRVADVRRERSLHQIVQDLRSCEGQPGD